MGCNAWNHSAGCDCGWGGATGGGGGMRIFDGAMWTASRKAEYHSYVNPNAFCPVCNQRVFFYQSPYGGRVFFDSLGPPWPKHWCTDSSGSRTAYRAIPVSLASPRRETARVAPLLPNDAWRPLLVDEVIGLGHVDRIRPRRSEKLPGRYVYLPQGWGGNAPTYWRWHTGDKSKIEVSCIRFEDGDRLVERTFVVPCWLQGDEQFESWEADHSMSPPAEALNSIGFSLSFAWRTIDGPLWYMGLPCVSLDEARTYFEAAAEKGHWAAANNLAVMFRDGVGVERNLAKAFQLFDRAAQSLHPVAMRHLSKCYQEGLGCAPDAEMSAFVDELITVREIEEKGAA